ncbi:MAG: hypothetical protein ACRDJC_19735, partial [Thermomicrobiales bacterium]
MDTDRCDAVVPVSVGGDARLSRRAAARRLGTLLAAGVLVARRPVRVFAQEATPPPLARFSGETFVGETSEPGTFVAVVLGEHEGAAARLAR